MGNIAPVRVFWVGPGRDRVWNLQTGDAGVVLAGGISGQHFPKFEVASQRPARIPGRRWQAARFNERQVGLNVLVGDPVWAQPIRTGDAWRDLDDEWNSSLSEIEPGRLCFVTNHGYRWLDCRVESANDPQWSTEPGKSGMAKYEYVLASDEAFYSGFDVKYPVFDNAKGRTSGVVANLGQYEAYPILQVRGPGTFTIGSGDRKTTLPTLYSGDVLTINTDPNTLTVEDQTGANRRPELPRDHDLSIVVEAGKSREFFAQVASGTTESKVTAIMSPRYRRAW